MLNYIIADDVNFYISDGGLLCLNYKGEDRGRVCVKRLFPFQYPDEFISVAPENHTGKDFENEIGIIRNINELSSEQVELLQKELKKRYFMPDIIEIESIKENPGNIHFCVVTNAGKCEFCVTDMGSNIKLIGKDKVMLADVYGNRYCIPDISMLKDNELKILEIWI